MTPIPDSSLFQCPICNDRFKYGNTQTWMVWGCDITTCTNERSRDDWIDSDENRWRCVNDCNYDICPECVLPPERRLTPCTLSTLSVNQKVYYRPQNLYLELVAERVLTVKQINTTGVLFKLGELGSHNYTDEHVLPNTARIEDCYHLTDLTDGTEVGYTDIGEIVAPLNW